MKKTLEELDPFTPSSSPQGSSSLPEFIVRHAAASSTNCCFLPCVFREVFFGGSYNEMGLGENPDSIQDILTPGLLVLLLHTAFLTGNTSNKTLSQK